jgi:hypothetical protein
MRNAAATIDPTASVGPERVRESNPYRQLMAAVLRTAIDDCWKPCSPGSAGYGTLAASRRARAARAYVSSGDRAWPFSFENLCDALDLDAHRSRRALLQAPAGRPSAVTIDQILDWWRDRESLGSEALSEAH